MDPVLLDVEAGVGEKLREPLAHQHVVLGDQNARNAVNTRHAEIMKIPASCMVGEAWRSYCSPP